MVAIFSNNSYNNISEEHIIHFMDLFFFLSKEVHYNKDRTINLKLKTRLTPGLLYERKR